MKLFGSSFEWLEHSTQPTNIEKSLISDLELWICYSAEMERQLMIRSIFKNIYEFIDITYDNKVKARVAWQ